MRPIAPQVIKANPNNSRLRDKRLRIYDLASEVSMDDTAHGVRLANDEIRLQVSAPNLSDDEDVN